MSMKPVILLTFANDRDKYLDMIERENKNIYNSLLDHQDRGTVLVHKEGRTSIEDVFRLFKRFGDRTAIFHYGGHADGTHLQLETLSGDPQPADAIGLAQLMGLQKELQLVFLNGCATRSQVKLLFAAGVRAVIATTVPVNDKTAMEFAEQFYDALAGQATIEKAFNTARAFVATRYGQSRRIDIFHDQRHLKGVGKDKRTKAEIPWGLYINEDVDDGPEVLKWKLPASSRDTVIIRGSVSSYGDGVQVNTQLIEALLNEVVKHSDEAVFLMEAHKKSNRWNEKTMRQVIADCFPAPVGEQLRRLFCSSTINVDRLRQLVVTYKTIIELLCFTMLSQLWEEKFKINSLSISSDHIVKFKINSLAISSDHIVKFNSFCALNADSIPTFNYIKLIEAISGVFKEHNIQFFVEELNTLEKSIAKKDEFYLAYQFMEEMKKELDKNSVKADEIENFCVQAEQHLTAILTKLVFFVKYKLAIIKRIEILKPRLKDPEYLHNEILLDRVTAGIYDEQRTYDSFTDNDSVILFKDIKSAVGYLSLSPFVIDENALLGAKNSKLFFYQFQNSEKGEYHYKFVDNEEEKLIVSTTKYPQIKEQFEEFKRSMQ